MNNELMKNALKRAKKIPTGRKTKAKCKAVHAYIAAIKEMLNA